MRYILPSKSKKKKGKASSRLSGQLMTSATSAHDVPEVLDCSRIVITPPPKRQRVNKCQGPPAVKGSSRGSRRLDKGSGANVPANLKVPPMHEEPLVMQGSKISDP